MQGVLIGGLAHGTVREFGDREAPYQACDVLMRDPGALCDIETHLRRSTLEGDDWDILHLRYVYTGVTVGDIAYYALP